MQQDDNTVNIKPNSGRYHHGDLRSALISEGLKRLEAGPAEALSLREVARNVGVSATAVYRHFPDKAALIAALCQEGDALMEAAFQSAIANVSPGHEAFEAMGRAYVRFALAHPHLFKTMMTSPNGDPKLATATTGSMGMLVQTLGQLGSKDLNTAERNVRRVQAWSLVHGLAMLMLDGQIPPDETLIDQVVSSTML